jgi:hypothetical protein
VSPVKYELGFYILEDDILHSYRRENLKSYIHISVVNVQRNVAYTSTFPKHIPSTNLSNMDNYMKADINSAVMY